MDLVNDEAEFQEKLEDPMFMKFFLAETDKEHDGKLTFDDWKAHALKEFP